MCIRDSIGADERQNFLTGPEEDKPRRQRRIGFANLDDAAATVETVEGVEVQPRDLRHSQTFPHQDGVTSR